MPRSDPEIHGAALDRFQASLPVATPARVWDALLGGKNNFAVDRDVVDRIRSVVPDFQLAAEDSAGFRVRAVVQLVAAGVTQFVDCGPGFPYDGLATHEIAQRHNPKTRVLYVEQDEMILSWFRSLLQSNDRAHAVRADIFDPKRLFALDEVIDFLDWDRPVALLQTMTLGHCPADLDPAEVMSTYLGSLPAGSFSVISHCAVAPGQETVSSAVQEILRSASFGDRWFQPVADVERLLAGQHLVRPSVMPATFWLPGAVDGHDVRDLAVAAIGCTDQKAAERLAKQLDDDDQAPLHRRLRR